MELASIPLTLLSGNNVQSCYCLIYDFTSICFQVTYNFRGDYVSYSHKIVT